MIPAYQLIRSRRRKTLGISIRDAQVQVRAPVGVKQAEIDRFVRSRHDWIQLHLQRQQHRLEQYEVKICQQGRVPVAGRWHQLGWHRAATSCVQQGPDRLELSLASRIRRDEQAAVRDLLQQWFRDQARERLVARCRQLAEATGLHPTGISIGSWRARWGQCSSRGEVGLNWRLLQLEPALQDYVILHELCHLQQMNHGPRFHALLLAHCPAHLRYRAELTRYGCWLNW